MKDRITQVTHFFKHANEYPWHWTAGQVEEWFLDLLSRNLADSTLRHYQESVEMFCEYLISPHYGWVEECESRFGTHPVQVCHEWNTVAHLSSYEGHPDRRPMTREELQALFDYADAQVERYVRRGRKGALTAYRDATVFKLIYGWGTRCNETSRLDKTDFYRNPKSPELGQFGSLHVRYGKRTRGRRLGAGWC